MKTARIFKYLILVFLIFLISHFSPLISHTFAQTNPYSVPNTNPDVPKDMHFWTQTVMIEVLSAATCQLTGVDPISPNGKCLGIDQKTGKIGFVENSGGAIGLMGNMIAMTYTPPLHFSDYTQYLAQNFGIVKPAYAQQGVGFKGLTPLLPLWTAFRDLVYLIYVIVFAVIGLFIMLRVKIDPRTVMGIGNQLPKLIVSILLVTFSFAISGFLIDLMYTSIYLTFNVFQDPKISAISNDDALNKDFANKINDTQRKFNSDNALGVFNNLVGFQEVVTNSAGGVKDIVQGLFSTGTNPNAKGSSGDIFIISGIFNFFKDAGDLIRNALGFVLGWLAGALAFLIIAIAILWAMIRLWFILITSYVFFLIDVVTAPFWIIAGVFPGSPVGFSAWIRDMLSNLMVFPITIVLFLMGKVFINAFSGHTGAVFVPPLIGNPTNSAVGTVSPFGALIGLGIILIAPQVAAITKDLFKPPQFKYGAAIGKAIGVGTGAVNLPKHASSLGQFMYYRNNYLSEVPFFGKFIAPKKEAGGGSAHH